MAFVLSIIGTAGTFWFLNDFYDVFWMVPLMGFCQLSLFGGYAIYFPELFPTRLRSTGTSFCYNVGRFIAAAGAVTMGEIISRVGYITHDDGTVTRDPVMAWRQTALVMSSVFLVGLIALIFAPETKGQPLPD